jgi:transposase
MMDVICTGDGDIPLFVRVADGNESDRAVFAQLMRQFQKEWNLDSIYVADSALYSAENIQQLGKLSWITRVPRSLNYSYFKMGFSVFSGCSSGSSQSSTTSF